MSMAEMGLAVLGGGFGFILADGLDRFVATYSPLAAKKPTDRFTSDGAGTLANTLNVAAMPDWKRAAAAVGMVVVPAGGAMLAKRHPYVRGTLEGVAVGAGINAFKLLWSNVIMPMLIGKDTTTPALQKSYIARLYPAETAARINRAAQKTGSNAAGMLSDNQTGVGDVGPFALSGDSPYLTADQALRAGLSGDSPYETAASALRKQAGMGGDSPYASAEQALRQRAGMGGYEPGPPAGPGPGPQATPHKDESCGCGDPMIGFSSFLGDEPAAEAS